MSGVNGPGTPDAAAQKAAQEAARRAAEEAARRAAAEAAARQAAAQASATPGAQVAGDQNATTPGLEGPVPIAARVDQVVGTPAAGVPGDLAAEFLGLVEAASGPAPAPPARASITAKAGPNPGPDGVYHTIPAPPPAGPFQLRTPDGRVAAVEITRDPSRWLGLSSGGENCYDVAINGHTMAVNLEPGVDHQAKLDLLVGHFADLPPDMLRATTEVNVHKGANPADEYWKKKLNDPNFVSGATGGGGTMDFYHDSVDEGTLVHEAAHNYADEEFGDTDPRRVWFGKGTEWDAAVEADRAQAANEGRQDDGFPSPYGKHVRDQTDSDGEDFAEASRCYLAARDQGPAAEAQFRSQYPARAKILDEIYPKPAPEGPRPTPQPAPAPTPTPNA